MSSAGTACCTGRMGAEKDKRRLQFQVSGMFLFYPLFLCSSLFFLENVHVDALLFSSIEKANHLTLMFRGRYVGMNEAARLKDCQTAAYQS